MDMSKIMKGFEFSELGIAAYKSHQFHEAIKYFTKSIEYGKSHITLSYRASSYMHVEEYQKALDDYMDEVIKNVEPKMTSNTLIDRYSNIGYAYYQLNEFQLALDYYEKVTKLAPNNDKIILMISNIKEIIDNSSTKDYRVLNIIDTTMEHTNQRVVVVELSEVNYSHFTLPTGSVHTTYTFEATGKRFVFDFDLAQKMIRAAKNEEIIKLNSQDFTIKKEFKDGQNEQIHYHNNVQLWVNRNNLD